MNASSAHVPTNSLYSFGDVGVKETCSYILLMAPVGPGNLTVGYFRLPGSVSPSVPGLGDFVLLPVHLKIIDPTNQTLFEKDIVTPRSFKLDFTIRGQYSVYLTNNGNKTSPIPIALQFEQGNSQNKEADKYLLSLILTIVGITLISVELSAAIFSKKFRTKGKISPRMQ
jgi:hypothetical protein